MIAATRTALLAAVEREAYPSLADVLREVYRPAPRASRPREGVTTDSRRLSLFRERPTFSNVGGTT